MTTMVQTGANEVNLLPAHIDIDSIAETLAERGWIIIPEFFPADTVGELREQAQTQWDAGGFRAAGIGRGQKMKVNESIRSDQVYWLARAESGVLADYQDFVETLRQSLNRLLYLGLFEFEAHFSVYPPGAFYRRHLDNFRGSSSRLISTILYLNENWHEGDCGQLRFYPNSADSSEYIDIFPHAGTLVLFRSALFWHEVLPARKQRFSLTGWLREREKAF